MVNDSVKRSEWSLSRRIKPDRCVCKPCYSSVFNGIKRIFFINVDMKFNVNIDYRAKSWNKKRTTGWKGPGEGISVIRVDLAG